MKFLQFKSAYCGISGGKTILSHLSPKKNGSNFYHLFAEICAKIEISGKKVTKICPRFILKKGYSSHFPLRIEKYHLPLAHV